MGDTLRLGEDGGEVVVVAWLHAFYLAGIHILLVLQVNGIIDGAERLVVEHFGTLHHQLLGTHLQVLVASLQLLHGHHGLATLLHRQEIDHGRGLVGIVVEGLHRHLREEGERTLRAHHRVGDDVEGIVVGDERTDVQARHVLDTIFGTDARGQFLVGSHTVAQGLDLLQELRMTLSEGFTALR